MLRIMDVLSMEARCSGPKSNEVNALYMRFDGVALLLRYCLSLGLEIRCERMQFSACVCVCVCVCVCRKPCEYELQSEYRSVSQRLSEMAAVISPQLRTDQPLTNHPLLSLVITTMCVCVCVRVRERERSLGIEGIDVKHLQLACLNRNHGKLNVSWQHWYSSTY